MNINIVEKENNVLISNKFVSFSFSLEDGRYSGIELRSGKTVLSDNEYTLDGTTIGRQWHKTATKISYEQRDIKDEFGDGKVLQITYSPQSKYQPTRILLLTIYENHPFVALGFGIHNSFDYNVRICRVDIGTGKFMHEENLVNPQTLRGGSGAEPNYVENKCNINALNSILFTGKIDSTRYTVVAGGLRYKEFMRELEISDKNSSKMLTMLITDPHGKTILPGETYISKDSVYLDIYTKDPFEALEKYGMALRTANQANPNTYDFPTLCGWMVSTKDLGEGKPINNSIGLIEQADIANASGITKYTPVAFRLEPDYYCYKQNGDTQQGWWDNKHWAKYGSLQPPYETFEKFCTALKERNGIPFTYFQASMPSNDFALAHPEWMLNNDISRLHSEHMHAHPFVRYDYTEPGFQQHVINVWRKLRDAGLKGVKFDYPETAWSRNGGFEDISATTVSAYRKLFELCREGLGKDAYIHERILGGEIHENVPRTDVNAGIVDLQRVWNDSSHFEPEMASRIGLRWYKSRTVFIYYPDGKSLIDPKTRKPLSTNQRRTFLSVIAMLSGRLELGTSFGSMTKDMLHDISRVFPTIPGTKSPRPVDMFMGKKHPELYLYEVESDWRQLLLFNSSDNKKVFSIKFAGDSCETGALQLNPKKEYYVYSFWDDSFVGKFSGATDFNYQLDAREAAVISIREVHNYPQIISTNRHIMQGMLEIHDLRWDIRQCVLTGRADVVSGDTLKITVAHNGYIVDMSETDSGRNEIKEISDELIDIILDSNQTTQVKWKITFKQNKKENK